MQILCQAALLLAVFSTSIQATRNPVPQILLAGGVSETSHDISAELFDDLEELSRIVDISYCVGVTGTGIQKPFLCASRCQDFEHFELVTVSNRGVNYCFVLLTSCPRHGTQESSSQIAAGTLRYRILLQLPAS